MTPLDQAEIDRRLHHFLSTRMGTWPPRQPFALRPWHDRDQPGWDGQPRPWIGVESPEGTVITYSPSVFPEAVDLDPVSVEDELGDQNAHVTIPAMFGRPDMHFGRAVYRFIGALVDLPTPGEWIPRDDPRLPAWLRPFNGDVLVAFAENGAYAAGVGLKRHNEHGTEIAVGTDPRYRGRGLARQLVAQAARTIWESGAIPLYLHGDHNAASAHVADRAGFPDRGWHIIEVR